MTDSPENPVQRQLDAYNRRDTTAFVACFAENVSVYHLSQEQPALVGRETFAGRYAELFASSPQLHCTLVKRMVCPPFVIDEEHVTGMRGKEGVVHAIAIYQVNDGIIQKVWFAR